MRFSAVFVYFALAVGLAIAGPLTDRDTGPSLTDVGNSTQPNPEDPSGQKSPSHTGPEDEEAEISIVRKRAAISKREDYNTLDKRVPTILYLCVSKRCGRSCFPYYLDNPMYHFYTCY